MDPNQKERIILALQKTGHVVGYMGDGINDAPALHAADVGLSVDNGGGCGQRRGRLRAAEDRIWRILRQGIDEGRMTFANTLKYILTTISANFGNMFSMAGASMFLPFLPLLAPQILLNNFLSDIPAITIAGDNVDPEMGGEAAPLEHEVHPQLHGAVRAGQFDLRLPDLRRRCCLCSTPSPEEFRTGWFIESLMTELVIALVVRTRHLFFRSRPGTLLLASTIVFIGIALATAVSAVRVCFGFVPLPAPLMLAMLGLTALYVLATELAKKYFYSRIKNAAV